MLGNVFLTLEGKPELEMEPAFYLRVEGSRKICICELYHILEGDKCYREKYSKLVPWLG